MEDEEIIALLYARSEQALHELDIKYGKILHQLSYNILGNAQDAEECVNDTYLAAWNAIPPAHPDPLQAYLFKILRNLSLKAYYHSRAAKRKCAYDVAMQEVEGCLPSPDLVEAQLDARELTRTLEAFLDTLSAENRVIFLRRYWFSDSIGDIARRVGISENLTAVRLTRIRKQLKQYLSQREVYV
ncbi:MAG: RNA polymerase sigma factor [Firmicutes bacterium]|nr:RNA polymerase sigma factor [Bacillota bacterium]